MILLETQRLKSAETVVDLPQKHIKLVNRHRLAEKITVLTIGLTLALCTDMLPQLLLLSFSAQSFRTD